jgi:hypothetical protein
VRRDGLTLFEVVSGIAIAAILSFAFYATFSRRGDQTSADERVARATAAATLLFDIASAIADRENTNTPTSFRQTVGAYPTALSQLTARITGADRNSCDRVTDVFSAASVAAWNGPYVTTTFVAGATTRLVSGYNVQDDMVRVPASPPGGGNSQLAARLQIHMPSVTQADAQALDAVVDQTLSGASGTVRYTASDPTTLDYELTVSGC